MEERFKVRVDDTTTVTAVRSSHSAAPRKLFAYAPGAGSNLDDPFGAYCARRLADEGISCWRFQFPYMEVGRRAPDRTATLEATWLAVIHEAQKSDLSVAVGGRSMGGRIASHIVAQGAGVAALALLAYPLHPPGKPDQRRVEHLASIRVPTLFCSGSRDTFASPDEITQAAALVPESTVHVLDGADHGFGTLKSSGRTREDVWAEAVDALLEFFDSRLTS